MRPVFIMLSLIAISMMATWLMYFPTLKIAKEKNLVDAPSSRKLQDHPIPVMGGIAVFFGIIIGLCCFKTTISYVNLISTIGSMMIMLYIGTIDDILDIPARIKFLIEIAVSLLLIYGIRSVICNFQGALGIEKLSLFPAMILTCVSLVGIINAINMIDGVDGLSSGFCIFASSCFGLFFFLTREYSYSALAFISIGAMIPFFIHNVFGKKSKMYLGDGGSLMMGILLGSMCIMVLNGKGFKYDPIDFSGFNLVAFCLSVLAVPVFDTIRVMTGRVMRKQSPFSADRTHFHHILLNRGLKPIAVTFVEIALNLLIVFVFLLSWRLGFSHTVQLLTVTLFSLASLLSLSWLLKR